MIVIAVDPSFVTCIGVDSSTLNLVTEIIQFFCMSNRVDTQPNLDFRRFIEGNTRFISNDFGINIVPWS